MCENASGLFFVFLFFNDDLRSSVRERACVCVPTHCAKQNGSDYLLPALDVSISSLVTF